jgi:hypothetical protein
MATTEEKQQLIETIKRPDRYFRIQVYGYGAEMSWCPITKKCHDWWQANHGENEIYAENYMSGAEEFREQHDMPQEADFLWDSEYESHSDWHEPPNEECHWYGCSTDSSKMTIEEVDSPEYNATVIEELYDGDFNDFFTDVTCEHDIDDSGYNIPKGHYAQMISSEKGTFFEGTLHLKGEPFDINNFKFHSQTMPNDEEILSSISYGEHDVDNQGGDTTGKGYSVYFYEE